MKKINEKLLHENCIFFQWCYCKLNDGVWISSSLGSVFAKGIIIEIGKEFDKRLTESGLPKFYMTYVDDTFLVAREEFIDCIFHKFNYFNFISNFQ